MLSESTGKLVSVSASAASAFEMGKYHEVCFGLDVAAWEKDAAWTIQLVQDILDSIGTIGDFTKSDLYQHMAFTALRPEFSDGFRQEFLKSLEDESFHYVQGNESWEKIIG